MPQYSRLIAVLKANAYGHGAIELARPVWQLSLAHRQQIEILRVLAAGARVLILDEPTSVLSPLESRGLFRIIAQIP